MSKVVGAAASSHAFALWDPDDWDRWREMNRAGYKRRWGVEPPVNPKVEEETPEGVKERYSSIKGGLDRVDSAIKASAPDVMLIFGDDQHEHFTNIVPQIAIFTGESLKVREFTGHSLEVRHRDPVIEVECDSALARHLLKQCIDAEFDVTEVRSLPEDVLFSHALSQIVHYYDLGMPIIPIWINGIVPPSPSPTRCYEFGQEIRKAIESFPEERKAFLYGSGGLSHFTGGYPYAAMTERVDYGSIKEEFDLQLIDTIRQGRGHDLAKFTSDDFLDNGEIETRQWVTIMGATGDVAPEIVEYGSFYRAIMGMGVAYWDLN